jgi:competence protein ComEC
MKKRILGLLFSLTLVFSLAVYGNTSTIIQDGDFSIHFFVLGNRFTGDAIYINYGEFDILIDAGSRQSSATTIIEYIDNNTQNGILDFVIVTHAHQDHIDAFNSSRTVTGILDNYEIGMIIDFPNTNSRTVTYSNYMEARKRAIQNGTVHFTALQCYRNEAGAQRIYELTEYFKLEILYNFYYENNTRNENDYSVCIRITFKDFQFLFTGDLEKSGEEKLVEYYEMNYGGLGHFTLFKAGHHGSNTSSNEILMAAITPEFVIVTACAGTAEFRASPHNTFPSQAFIDRVAPYTDKVFVTTLIMDYSQNYFVSFNGDIVFVIRDGIPLIFGSNNNTKLKDTDWFSENRQMPEVWK